MKNDPHRPYNPDRRKLVASFLNGLLLSAEFVPGHAADQRQRGRSGWASGIRNKLGTIRRSGTVKMVQPWCHFDRRYGMWWRVGNGAAAILLLAAVVIPVLQEISNANSYRLSAEALQLVGHTDPTLAKQLTYDARDSTYQFNKNAIKSDDSNPLAAMQSQVGTADGKGKDKSLYALDVPTDFSKGVTYHDVNSSLSFSLVPQFQARSAKAVDGHLVFPLADDTQAVYTLKNNGLKEDIVLNQPSSDTMSFSYDLNLPKTLEAKVLPDGSGGIGIYSADPMLFGDITYGSDADRTRIEKAREIADKTYLVFGLPTPVVKDTSGQEVGNARFELDGNQLTVVATGLSSTHGTLTIDPSVVVTSTSDFQSGNNESNIDFGTPGQINRGGLTGGSLGSGWTVTTNLPTTRAYFGSVAYNNYLYILGGSDGTNTLSDVEYAPINTTTGALGSWSTTTSLPAVRASFGTQVYNGYLYVIGGNSTGGALTDTQYARINANGTLGSWSTTSSFTTARSDSATAVYNDHLYLLGGALSGTYYNDVQYAQINANGTLGSWSTTSSFTATRNAAKAVAYNGYLYVIGGYGSGGFGFSYRNDVQYAPINADGTLGSWSTTSSFTTARGYFGAMVYNGYLYIAGGFGGTSSNLTYLNDVQYAQINANGTIGAWQTTSSIGGARAYYSTANYNGYLYALGGFGGTYLNDVQYAKIDPAGTTGGYTASTVVPPTGSGFPGTTTNAGAIAYKGYIYQIGGYTNAAGNYDNKVIYAPLNSDGSIGTWSTTSSLVSAAGGFGLVVYNGYIYVVGGFDATSTAMTTVQYTSFNSNGTLAAWSTTSSLVQSTANHSAAAYNGYMYAVGSVGGGSSANVQKATINSDGTIGSWVNLASNLQTSRYYEQMVATGGYLYVVGGNASGTLTPTVEYAAINSSNGALGAFAYTSNLNTARARFQATFYNGYIYVVGGSDATNTADISSVEYAPVLNGGGLGTWRYNTALPATIKNQAVTAYNGYIYSIAGTVSGTRSTNTYYAPINNGGSGAVGTWASTSTFTTARSGHSTVAYNGYLYILGGTGDSDVQYAPINANGSVGTWQTTTAFSAPRANMGAIAYQGYMYAVGGYNSTGGVYYNDVQYAPINSNGTLGNWSSAGSFTTARGNMGAAIWNGYLYVLGGINGATYYNDVQYASINSSGTLDSWGTSTSLPAARGNFTALAYGGYLYVLGGENSSFATLKDVQYAPINSNGTLGNWQATASFSSPRMGFNAVAYDGYMYILGGQGSAFAPSYMYDVQYVPINFDGSLGSWAPGTILPTARQNFGSAVYKGNVYIAGGTASSGSLNDVQYAPLNTIARQGTYSKLIDLGSSVTPSGLAYTGTLPGGVSSITYRTAGSDGILSAAQLASTMNGGAGGVCGSGSGSARYLWVSVNMDDSNGAGFADSSGADANIQDITVSYGGSHPPPNIRLRAGQTLQNGTLSALDTCYP